MHRAGFGAGSEQGLCHVAAEVLWCQEEQLGLEKVERLSRREDLPLLSFPSR